MNIQSANWFCKGWERAALKHWDKNPEKMRNKVAYSIISVVIAEDEEEKRLLDRKSK